MAKLKHHNKSQLKETPTKVSYDKVNCHQVVKRLQMAQVVAIAEEGHYGFTNF
jgi:hypothetical protein